MRYGFWAPVFGGWLRNVPDEGMAATWDYTRRLCQRAEQIGYDLTLIAELNLNDIKGTDQPALDAWSTAAALAAVTERLELMVAVRPNFHHPALFAKQAANIDQISGGRLSLNVVSSWWAEEARSYGLQFDQHDDRYARTREWLEVVDGLWREPRFTFAGERYQLDGAICEPKPVKPPVIYAGGESEAAKTMIAGQCDAYVMHGDEIEVVAGKIADMEARRAVDRKAADDLRHGRLRDRPGHRGGGAPPRSRGSPPSIPPPRASPTSTSGSSGTELERELKIQEYSVSNRGLRPGLIGTPETIRARIAAYEAAGVDLLLLQMSPQYEEMERFAHSVIKAPP